MKTEDRYQAAENGTSEKPRKRRRRIGIFGGSFNPIHNGHLGIAEEAMKACRLSEVWFIPAGDPYMKSGTEMLPGETRLRLTECAVSDIPAFSVNPIEVLKEGASYTADTLRALSDLHPDCRFFLIVGEDAFRQMPLWKNPEEILKLSELIVASRKSGEDVPDYRTSPIRVSEKRLHRIETDIDISSTKIRRMIHAGESIRGLVPESAEAEILRAYKEA